jgi:hypothetical protein
VEFHLSEDASQLCLIFCDSYQRLHLGPTAACDHWFFEGHPPVEAVERELAAAGLGFRRQEAPHEPTIFMLRLDSGVELLLSRSTDPVMEPGVAGLFGFQYAHRARG